MNTALLTLCSYQNSGCCTLDIKVCASGLASCLFWHRISESSAEASGMVLNNTAAHFTISVFSYHFYHVLKGEGVTFFFSSSSLFPLFHVWRTLCINFKALVNYCTFDHLYWSANTRIPFLIAKSKFIVRLSSERGIKTLNLYTANTKRFLYRFSILITFSGAMHISASKIKIKRFPFLISKSPVCLQK